MAQAPDKLTFSSMTWDILEERYGLRELPSQSLLSGAPPVPPSDVLQKNLRRARRSRLINERARAYRLIDPVISELEDLRAGKISSLPEMPMAAPGVEGLCGTPDFIISGSTTHKFIPIISIVEAKREDIDAGIPQCVAELYASYLLNGRRPARLYGCVTTGDLWKFLCLTGETRGACQDTELYFVNEIDKLLGAFCQIIDTTLAALGSQESAELSPSARSPRA